MGISKVTYVREALVAIGALALFLVIGYTVSHEPRWLSLAALLVAVGWWASGPRVWGR